MSKLLFNEKPIVIDTGLAMIVGLNQAVVIQQIHYWIEINQKKKQNFYDGKYWTYNTVEEWQEQFPFWSFSTVKRILKELRNDGILFTNNYNRLQMDRTIWYSINYEKLYQIKEENTIKEEEKPANPESVHWVNLTQCNGSNCTNALGQNEQMQQTNLNLTIPEISTEISTGDYPSIYPTKRKIENTKKSASEEDKYNKLNEENKRLQEELQKMKNTIYKNTQKNEEYTIEYLYDIYNYDVLAQMNEEQAKQYIIIIHEILNSNAKMVKINGDNIPVELVKSRFLKLNHLHFEYVMDNLRTINKKIKNIRSYVISSLYNSYTTIDTHYDNLYRADIGE